MEYTLANCPIFWDHLRYRAYKALQQMQDDENFSEYAVASMYPIFHEAISLPVVREWLGWNLDNYQFENAENRESFYQLIIPRTSEHGEDREPKIKSYSDIRHLRDILGNNDAKADLLQMDRDLIDALTIANRSEMSRRWKNELNEAITALQNIPALEVKEFQNEDVESINKLIEMYRTRFLGHKFVSCGGPE